MLDLLRRKSSSIAVKVILGTIVIVFVFFFGSSTMNQGLKARQTAATVNGDPISERLVAGMFQFQMDNNPMYKQIPDEMKLQMRQSILNALIEESVLLEQAEKAGLRVSDLELAAEIKQNPQFQKNGLFDLEAYNNNFRPAFLSVYGIDYEAWVRRNLLRDKLDDLFAGSLFFSEAYVAHQAKLTQPTYKFKHVAISQDANPPEGAKSAADLSAELWPAFKSGKLAKSTLETHHLEETETPELPLFQLNQALGGDDTDSHIQELLKLSAESPTPAEPIKIGDTYHFIRLVEKKIPKKEESESQTQELAQTLPQSYGMQWMAQWTDELIKKASIKIAD